MVILGSSHIMHLVNLYKTHQCIYRIHVCYKTVLITLYTFRVSLLCVNNSVKIYVEMIVILLFVSQYQQQFSCITHQTSKSLLCCITFVIFSVCPCVCIELHKHKSLTTCTGNHNFYNISIIIDPSFSSPHSFS